jgi:ferrous iron transport protein B
MSDATSSTRNVALVGNPNSGKSTLFNALTGLNQKTGNFPGVTVEKHTGKVRISGMANQPSQTINFIDLPGTYCLYPKSPDELETLVALIDRNSSDFPDLILMVADASNLNRSLLLCTQLIDLGIPMVLAVNMIDLLEDSGQELKLDVLSESLGIPVVSVNAREKKGIREIKSAILQGGKMPKSTWQIPQQREALVNDLQQTFPNRKPFEAYLIGANQLMLEHRLPLSSTKEILAQHQVPPFQLQSEDSLIRYTEINRILDKAIGKLNPLKAFGITNRIDNVLTHPLWGFITFMVVLLMIFQAVFSWSELPMDLIDQGFILLSSWLTDSLPAGSFTDLLTQGILPGLGGILMFIPQIAILFGFIAILEDSGYMARVSFIMDRLLRRFGINGRSIIPLISGVACAVPAIMSARTIKNTRERLITIFITPLMSCSARLPVYTLLIAIAIPDEGSGFFNTRGLLLMALYLLGFVAALFSALLMKFWVKTKERSIFIMELPVYRMPQLSVMFYTMVDKVKVFVLDAGKIIIAISIVLWVLSSYGPGNRFAELEKQYSSPETIALMGEAVAAEKFESEKLRYSYAGYVGRAIEPAIEPLGFDWKIGIALVTSFAAREVFVGTMATIYGAGSADEDTSSLKMRMQQDVWDGTNNKIFTFATSFALILFYAFAMQCMSTLAVVKRETGSWKWPIIQFFWFGALAWLSAFAAQQFLG